jgi:hypothetical protein
MKPIWSMLCFAPSILALYVLHANWGWWRDDSGFDRWVMKIGPILLGLIATAVLTGACAGIAEGVSSLIRIRTDLVWQECWTAKMVSMRSADGVSGSLSGGIFMIVGHVDTDQIYFYYTLNQDGSFQPHKWKADDLTRIYEEDRQDGEVHQFDIQLKRAWMSWFTEPDERLKMEFHIPKGSLKQQFKVQ